MMACESPPRKRAKLSLKFSKGQKSFDSPTKTMRKLKLSSVSDSASGLHTKTEGDQQGSEKSLISNGDSSHPPEPYVGFYNIGNTCYLNSVLQALRYCPEFVETLRKVLEMGEMWLEQKNRSPDGVEVKDAGNLPQSEDVFEEDVESICRMLTLLKEMHKVFDLMRDKEDNFLLMPSPDTDMAINPEMVLDALRTVNPMFEGYFQHDAQELLCSLLSSFKEVQQKLSKDMKCDNKDAINNNVPPVALSCRTPTATKNGGSLKGGCSPGLVRSAKRGVLSNSPVAARKHLCYPSADGDGRCKTDAVATSTGKRKEAPGCTNGSDGGKSKKFRRKSMRNRQLEGEASGEISQEKAIPKDTKGGKKKSLGIKRLYKLTNQPSILSKLGILKKKQPNPRGSPLEEADKSHLQTLLEDNGLSKGGVSEGGIDNHSGTEPAPVSPPRDANVKVDWSGTPTVVFQHPGRLEDLFQGSLVLRTKCMECENHTERCEEFQDISVPVHCLKKSGEEEEDCPEQASIEHPTESNDSCDVGVSQATLDWALSEFTLGERLTDTNKYFCDSCLHLTEAERFLLFDELPQVMVIHLKRFSALQQTFSPGGSIPKLNDVMETPLSITMDRWCTKSCRQRLDTYRLLSVVSHTGSSSSSGHYLSYVRVPKLEPVCTEDGKIKDVTRLVNRYQWVLFDDDQVSSLSDEEFDKCINHPSDSQEAFDTPYLLFYSRVPTEADD